MGGKVFLPFPGREQRFRIGHHVREVLHSYKYCCTARCHRTGPVGNRVQPCPPQPPGV